MQQLRPVSSSMSGGNERLRTACNAYQACEPYDCRLLADAGGSLVPLPAQYGDELGLGDAPHALARPVVFDAQVVTSSGLSRSSLQALSNLAVSSTCARIGMFASAIRSARLWP